MCLLSSTGVLLGLGFFRPGDLSATIKQSHDACSLAELTPAAPTPFCPDSTWLIMWEDRGDRSSSQGF